MNEANEQQDRITRLERLEEELRFKAEQVENRMRNLEASRDTLRRTLKNVAESLDQVNQRLSSLETRDEENG